MCRLSAGTRIRCGTIVFAGIIGLAMLSTSWAQPAPSAAHRTIGDTVSVMQLSIPEKARTELTKALDDFHKSRFDNSLKHANAALAISPAFPNALTLRGYIELTNKEFEAARTDLEHALDADPHFTAAYLYLGAVLNRLGQYDEALRRLDRHNEISPGEWESYFEISKSWMGKHEYQRTLEAINHASRLGADAEVAAAVHFVRGRALAGLQQYAPAKVELQEALSRQSTGGMADLTRELIAAMDRESAVAAK